MSIKSFSGARVKDMEDYLKPLIRKEPDELILHMGTNNIRDNDPREVAERYCKRSLSNRIKLAEH